MTSASEDPVLWNDWHVVADEVDLRGGRTRATRLLGIELEVSATGIRRMDGTVVSTARRYGFVWACLGEPVREIVDIAEAGESDRLVITGGSFGVHVSAPRVRRSTVC